MPGANSASATADNPFHRHSQELVERFIADNPGYCLAGNAGGGSTNRVLLGRRGRQGVVFKCYWSPGRWRNELYFLRLLERTGLAPKVIASVDGELIVMRRLPGTCVTDRARALAGRTEALARLSREVGQALGRIVQVPLAPDRDGYHPARNFTAIPWGDNLRVVVETYVQRCRNVERLIPRRSLALARRSLALVASRAAAIGGQPQVVFHEDVGNMHACRGHFRGFFDLEMARNGTEAMQLGGAVSFCGPGGLHWPSLLAGYREQTGRGCDVLDVLAMNHLYHWIRVCRWGRIGGDADKSSEVQAAASEAGVHLERIAGACHVLWVHTSVHEWFDEGNTAR